MRLTANVQIYNRVLPSLNVAQRRTEQSFLTIGQMPGNHEVSILHQTAKNGVGTRYKVRENVEEIFAKFVHEGKATVRLKEPPLDIRIKSAPKDLAHFIQVVKTFLNKRDIAQNSPQLSNLAGAIKKVSTPKVKLVVERPQDLPTLNGYPRTLHTIVIKNCRLSKIDGRILRLQGLTVLNLEGNNIDALPEQIDLLPNLKELHLAKNKIGPSNNWKWLRGKVLQKNLIHLDLGGNKLTYLPSEIAKFKNLKHLNISENTISYLPSSLGRLSKLKELNLSNNKIKWLPGSFQFVSLSNLDVSGNEGCPEGFIVPIECKPFVVPKLVDIAAKTVLSTRAHYTEETLPRELICYIENASYCHCLSANFPNVPEACIGFPLRKIATVFMYSGNSGHFPLGVRTCSNKCLTKLRFILSY